MKSSNNNDVILPLVLLDTALLFHQKGDVVSLITSIVFGLLALFGFITNLVKS